jgi:hypothetical protein
MRAVVAAAAVVVVAVTVEAVTVEAAAATVEAAVTVAVRPNFIIILGLTMRFDPSFLLPGGGGGYQGGPSKKMVYSWLSMRFDPFVSFLFQVAAAAGGEFGSVQRLRVKRIS